MLNLQTTIDSNIIAIFNNGECIGEISKKPIGFEAAHVNGVKAYFNTFEAAKSLFEEVVKPTTVKRNNQLNLF